MSSKHNRKECRTMWLSSQNACRNWSWIQLRTANRNIKHKWTSYMWALVLNNFLCSDNKVVAARKSSTAGASQSLHKRYSWNTEIMGGSVFTSTADIKVESNRSHVYSLQYDTTDMQPNETGQSTEHRYRLTLLIPCTKFTFKWIK